MKLTSISNFDRLNAEQQYQYIMQAKANGLIGDDYSIAQVSDLYKRDQLSKIGIDPNASEEGANAYLRLNQLSDLAQNNQLGQEFSSLFELARVNPLLASSLADQAFNSGYMTLDERNKAALSNINAGGEEGTSWLRGAVTDLQFWRDKGLSEDQDPDEFSTRAFNDYYRDVKKTRESTAVGRAQKAENPEKWERETLEEARRTYLDARNQRIYNDIQKQIDTYWDQEADKRAAVNLQEMNAADTDPETSNQIAADFNRIVSGWEQEFPDGMGGTRIYRHPGSDYWAAYKDSAFDDFGLDQQKEVLAKYNAYSELLGPEKADQWLNDTMQEWVSDHQSGLDRALNTGKAFANTILNNVGPRMLSFGVWGEAKLLDYLLQGYQLATGQEVTTNMFGDIASIISTGKTQLGETPEEAGFNALSAEKPSELIPGMPTSFYFLRQDYLSKVDAYNTWDINDQKRAEANHGVSGNEQYVLKPGQTSPDFWSAGTFQDVLGMTSQIVGQTAALWLYGGGNTSFASLAEQVGAKGSKALLSKEAMQAVAGGFKDATITAAPIAESYAYGTYQQTYNGALEAARQSLEEDAQEAFLMKQGSDEYIAERDAAYQAWLNDRGTKEAPILKFDSPRNREYFNQDYDRAQYEKLRDEMSTSREKDVNMLAQSAALDAYMTSFIGEYGKYGMLNAIMNPLKVLKSPNQVLASELRTNAYGKLTQNAAGRFTNEGVPLLGVKKWTVTDPRVIGTMNIAKNAIISGGLSNYTDELTTGFAMGYGLSRFNSEYLRHYDPDAYANTWHGGSSIGQLMDAIGEGISGAAKAGMSEQAFHAFEIGALGGLFAPRLSGVKQMKERYRQENQEYMDATGQQPNLFKRFRQGFNTYVTGAVGEYELTRFGMKESAQTVDAYNTALDERDQLFTELASLHQGIANSASAAASNDFATTAATYDALAMKLLYNEHRLSSNPLHQISNQQANTALEQLTDISQGITSDAEQERLIMEALSTSQTTKQGPVTQQMKDQTWAEIQNTAKRMSDFMSDYKQEEARLLDTDASLNRPENYPILTQRAELKAQELRLKRDLEQLGKDSGIQIDASQRGTSYGEMTPHQQSTLIKGAQDTIDRLEAQKETETTKLEELNEKIATETDEAKIEKYQEDALQTRANIMGIERQVNELNQGIQAIENSELLLNSTRLTTDAIILDDMLSNPDQYTDAQKREIEAFRQSIGPQGETYVRELAKMQDQLTDNLYAQEAIQNNPQDFLLLHSAYAKTRNEARNRAVYEQELVNRFSQIAQASPDIMGIQAAISLTPQQFKRFQRDYPNLSPMVQQYAPVNAAFSTLQSLFNPSDKALRSNILSEVASLMDSDLEYVRDNGSQGVADMLEFLKSQHAAEPVTRDAIDNLLTDYKRAESLAQSTVAYTEYKIKKMAEQSRQKADELVKQLEEAEKSRQEQEQARIEQEQKQQQESYPDQSDIEGGEFEDLDIDLSDVNIDVDAQQPRTELKPEQPQQTPERVKEDPYKKAREIGILEEGKTGGEIRANYDDERDGQGLSTLQQKALRKRVEQVLRNPASTKENLMDAVNSKAHNTKTSLPSLHFLYKVQDAVQKGEMTVDEALAIVDSMMGTPIDARVEEGKTAEGATTTSTQVEGSRTEAAISPESGTEVTTEPVTAPSTQVAESTPVAPEKLPTGVTRNAEGNLETMTAEEQAQQMGITEIKEDSMVDDSKPRVQEVTNQQEEVHGTYFNMYESSALNHGELVPYTEGPVYEWLEGEGIKLGEIIDNELSKILQANPKVQLMKVKKEGKDASVASNVFLVVEYTDKVAKHHLPSNGGVITSGGKRYLVIGTMWNTKSQDGTEAANLMQTTRDNLQRNGVTYFDANPAERFYVDQDMHTEVTTFYSGHIVHTINEESRPHTLQELLDQHNSTHTSADQMSFEDLGFGVITMKQGFYPVGPYSADKIHAPQKQTVDKYGQVYVLVPAANGEIVPIFINPTLLSEINKDSQLKTRIDQVLVPQLLSTDYDVREQAVSELCQLLCISGSITSPEGKGILIGKKDIPTVSLVNGKSIVRTFDVKKSDFTIEEFREALYSLNPRINLSLSNLAQPGWVQRYDEAGALMTDATKLGTYGGKFYVAPINPATGQPIRVEQRTAPSETSSDYSRAQTTPTMLPVGGQTYVLRDGRWVHQSDGSPVTDKAEQAQVTWAYRVNTGRATLSFRQGAYDYYVMDVETDKPRVVAYNLTTRSYQGVPEEFANQIIAEERAKIERARAEEAAQAALEQEAQEGTVLTEEAPEAVEAAETETEVQEDTTEAEKTESNVTQEAPKAKNDFQLNDTSSRDRHSVDDILDSADDAMMDYADRIYDIIENKKATSEKWADFNMEDITAELERLGIEANNIDDIESWIDNLENCE